jgi:tetratricopeptide (TPR) repeat protein
VKTEKDLLPAKRASYLKALSALEIGNHSLVVSLLQPIVAEEPEFFAARRLLREAQVMRTRGAAKSGLFGISTGGLSLGKSKAQGSLKEGNWQEAMNAAEKALETDPTNVQANKDLFAAAEFVAQPLRDEIRQSLEPAFEAAVDEQAKRDAAKKVDIARDKMRTFEAISRFALETIALDPKNTKVRHELGDYLMQIEEYGEASKVFEETLRKSPMDLDARDKAKEAAHGGDDDFRAPL